MESVGKPVSFIIERDGNLIETTLTTPRPAVSLTQVLSDRPASDARMYPGDEIAAINGTPVVDAQSFAQLLTDAAGTTAAVDVIREGRALTLQLAVPTVGDDENVIDLIGVNGRVENPYEALGVDGIVARTFNKVSAGQIIPEGWGQFWEITSGTFGGLRTMVTDGVDPDTLVGPVGMGQMTSELLTQSATPVWVTLAMITVVISVALGVLNLMPLPALDGGRLLFVLIEVLRGGRRISPEKEGMVHLAGMLVLLGLMFFVAFGDVSRLVDGRSIFP
jgi:regulator of sigma E protease